MKKFAILVAGAMCVALPAFAYDRDDVREQEQELRSSRRMVDEDNRTIDKYEDYKAHNRAEKARAKANREYGQQAKESVQIGANEAAIGANKAKRKIDRKLVDKNRRELEEARDDDRYDDRARYNDRYDNDRRYYSNRRYYDNRELSPSAGERTFWGYRAQYDYPMNPDELQNRMHTASANY